MVNDCNGGCFISSQDLPNRNRRTTDHDIGFASLVVIDLQEGSEAKVTCAIVRNQNKKFGDRRSKEKPKSVDGRDVRS